MNQVLGKNMFFEMLISGVYYPLFCGKTADLQVSQDEIEVTHINSAADREYVPGMANSVINAVGVTVLDNTESRISLQYLLEHKRTIQTFRIRSIDQDATSTTISFDGFLTSATLSRDVAQWSQSSVSFRVTGTVDYSPTTPPVPSECEVEPTIYTTLADGALFISDALLIPGVGETIIILHVSRSGMTFYETTGTPGNGQFVYDSATGKITFSIAGSPAAPDLEPVSVEYRIET